MSSFIKTSAPKLAVVLGLVAASFSASAEQVSFSKMVDYTMTQQMNELRFDLRAQLEQSTYNMAFAQVNASSGLPGRRPVVVINEVKATEEDEE